MGLSIEPRQGAIGTRQSDNRHFQWRKPENGQVSDVCQQIPRQGFEGWSHAMSNHCADGGKRPVEYWVESKKNQKGRINLSN
jgi:hypothetical protein